MVKISLVYCSCAIAAVVASTSLPTVTSSSFVDIKKLRNGTNSCFTAFVNPIQKRAFVKVAQTTEQSAAMKLEVAALERLRDFPYIPSLCFVASNELDKSVLVLELIKSFDLTVLTNNQNAQKVSLFVFIIVYNN